jgi:putative aldouronate transport system substrate-binding protein
MKKNQIAVIALTAVLLLSGCGAGASANAGQSTGKSQNVSTSSSKNTSASFTYWTPLNAKAGSMVSDYSQLLCYQELERATGTKLSFIHPVSGQEKETFNLMLASREYPDMIEYNFSTGYPGGQSSPNLCVNCS